MANYDILDEIIQDLNPEDVRPEFIAAACLIDYDGFERVITGPELEYFLKNPDFDSVAEARVMLDVRKLRRAMAIEIDHVFDEVNRALTQENRDF